MKTRGTFVSFKNCSLKMVTSILTAKGEIASSAGKTWVSYCSFQERSAAQSCTYALFWDSRLIYICFILQADSMQLVAKTAKMLEVTWRMMEMAT